MAELYDDQEYNEDYEDLEDKLESKPNLDFNFEEEFTNPFVQKFQYFFDKYYKTTLEKLIRDFPLRKSLNIDFELLEQFDPSLADELIDNPDYILEAMLLASQKYKSSLLGEDKVFEPYMRILNLPKDKRIMIKYLSSRHIGKFVCIEGLVKQFTTVMPKLKRARFVCGKCGHELDLAQEGIDIVRPKMCPECKHKAFILDENNSEFIDYQKLEVQDLLENLRGGEQSSTINIYVQGDLVNTFTAGERLIITGILRLRNPKEMKQTVFGRYVLCSSIESSKQDYETIEITKEDEEKLKELSQNPEIYNMLVDSIAPHISGHKEIKEGVILQLFGGVRKILDNKSKIRGNIHILIVGDPGVGKSQILLAASKIAPKSIYIVGKTASGAGLCVGKDSFVFKNNKIMKIKDLVENNLINPKKDVDGNLISKALLNPKTKSFNLSNNLIEDDEIINYVKIPVKDKLLKIIDSNGLELITTKNTPILIDKGIKKYVKAKDLKIKDKLVNIKKLKIKSKSFDLLEMVNLENSKIKLSKNKVNEINKTILKKYKDKKTFCKLEQFSENLIYNCLEHRGISYPKLKLLLNKLDLKLNTKDIDYVFNSHGKSIKIPIIDADFMYLFGLILGDGDISVSKSRGIIRISNSNTFLLNRAIKIIKKLFGKDIKIELQKDKVPSIRLNSKILAELFYNLGYTKPKVNLNLNPKITQLNNVLIKSFLKGIFDTDGYVINRTTHGSNYIGLSSISKDFIYIINLLLRRFGIVSHIKSNYNQYELLIYAKENHQLFRKCIGFNIDNKKLALNDIIKKNSKVVIHFNNDIFLSEIKSISEIKDKFVYDFTVDKNHNFFANGFLVHNTASAVKDEFGEGGWTLKAGALVLASGGFAMVDEFDKMDAEDRSAMHEALEQETVSIAKAGIVTSFKTETSVLAAANPKFGRFNAYKTLPEQIEVPSTLMSRFDLFFILQDLVDEKKDMDTVSAIIKTHKTGALLQKQGYSNLSEKDKTTLEKINTTPSLDVDLIRKYISYARLRVFPVLSENAGKILQKFFINLRQKSQGGAVTVTFRQLEALIRLAEASARVRLSDKVLEEDVDRALRLYKKSMEQVGMDPETGEMDIDIITTGQSHSQTNRLMKVLDIIKRLSSSGDGVAKLEDIYKEAELENLDKNKTRELIEKLQKVGDIYEPRVHQYKPSQKD